MKCRFATIVKVLAVAGFVAPAVLLAQVPPPQKTSVDTAKRAPTPAAKARSDSANRMRLTDMKAWVDSAAGNSKPLATPADTAVATTNPVEPLAPPQPIVPQPVPRATTTFSNGAIAPNTASPLPTMLIAGLACFAAGLLLLRLRKRA